jgi:hypothetical protein
MTIVTMMTMFYIPIPLTRWGSGFDESYGARYNRDGLNRAAGRG